MINRNIGRYEIKEVIGEGAMAMVYRAYDPEIDRSVACKILKSEHCVDEEYVTRFMREAKAAGGLTHPNIVTVYDVGKIGDSPYIMMELLTGKDLGEILKERKTMSVNEVANIGLQLAKALDYAHSVGIVHRDIKPDNIIILSDNQTVKVADFGIASINEIDKNEKTQSGSVVGTPRYMSPEQALGEDTDGRSDLFSMGVIMYEMLTGVKAFDAKNMGTLMLQIAQKQAQSLKKLNPNVPIGMRQIVHKLLQKNADKRFQTGGDLAHSLIVELDALRDQQDEHKYVPLKFKLTLSAVLIIATLLAVSMKIIFNLQTAAITKQTVESGLSFARFIAFETSVPMLGEDWITLETFIEDAASRDTFKYIIVTDNNNIVRGSSNTDLMGQQYRPIESELVVTETDNNELTQTTSSVLEDGSKVFNINTPILFQTTKVGTLILGLSQDGLDEVKSTSFWLMMILAIVTVLSVAMVMFIFGSLISRPLKAIKMSLKSFAEGDFDTRISLSRKDELGLIFDEFNKMANSIQKSYTDVADDLAMSQISSKPLTNKTDAPDMWDDQEVDEETVIVTKPSEPKKED